MNDAHLDSGLDEVVRRYLDELATSLKALPAPRREQLVREINDHIAQLRSERPPRDLAELEEILNRVGLPEDIASAALEFEEIPSLSPGRRRARRVRVVISASAAFLLFALAAVLAQVFGAFDSPGANPGHQVAEITMPNLIGQTQPAVGSEMALLGLKDTIRTATSSSVRMGLVIVTSPGAGSNVKKGSTISVTVSAGLPS